MYKVKLKFHFLKKSALLLPVLAVYTAAGIIGGDERGTLPGSAYWLLIPCVFVVLGAFAIIYLLERRGKKE